MNLFLFLALIAVPFSHFYADSWYVNVPVVTMREAPNDTSEVVSQGYFSEEVRLLEKNNGFVKIETVLDHYQGFIPESSIVSRGQAFAPSIVRVNQRSAHIYHVDDLVYGPVCTLPFGSQLELIGSNNDPESKFLKIALLDGTEAYIQRGDVVFTTQALSKKELVAFSQRFLGLPYTWGGKSSFGYDCSGFVQMLYRQMGVYLPRDSKDQFRFSGFIPVSLDALSIGDLIFFGPAEDKVRHVGMYIGDNQFIHTSSKENSPYLRISRLSDAFWNGTGEWKFRAGRRLAEK